MGEKNENYRLLQSFRAGAEKVIYQKEELNKINVFPVADGDTGSNLASLMQAIIDNVPVKTYPMAILLDEISGAALRGARGNSGIIFAQYLSAVAENYQKTETNFESFVEALEEAVNKAYNSLIEPKEGTILTVMRAWSVTLVKIYRLNHSFEEALLEAKIEAQEALNATQFQMPVLRKNKLVDAGAKGFYYFILGFTDFYCGKALKEGDEEADDRLELVKEISVEHVIAEAPRYRYCSEFILKSPQISEVQLRAVLQESGDSMVTAGNAKQLKLHIHTNEPQKVLVKLEKYGQIIYQKVDDMRLQYEISQKKLAPIAIVTDSIADLPQEFVLAHQVHILPVNVTVGDQNFLDKLTINAQLIKEKAGENLKMSTSQPSIQTIDALFSFLEGKYEHVLVITVASQLSGTYQLIEQRIKEKKYLKNWIHLIDSRLNSVAQGLLVQRAAQLAERGVSIQQLVQEIKQLRERIFIYVAVADLSPMIRSGRIPQSLGAVAQKLSLHPIISLDKTGNGKLIGASLSQKKSMKKILKKIQVLAKNGQIEDIALTHVLAQGNMEEWKKTLKEKTGNDYKVIESSSAIAISAGAGSIAVAGITKEQL
ncbi:DAK2 domain-containing protein [Lactococcus garvieae]|uniref:DAK2 domain-containing protein n=1 Tax=Lactococcus garvieae TaxID=1363 RepID=UPI00254CEC90|nr:DegV family protein [Lactococcus garvieae]